MMDREHDRRQYDRQDHELLVRVDERVGVIHQDVKELKGRVSGVEVGHNRRIAKLERWRSWILGALAALGALLGWNARQ